MKPANFLRAPAEPEQLEAATLWLTRLARDLSLDDQMILRMQLVFEELFLNTLRHGYTEKGNHIMELALEVEAGHAWLIYTDYAPPFDFSQKLEALGPVDPKREGGKGLYLIRDLPVAFEYQALQPGNRLRLRFDFARP
ncbi:MAG: ATP-binding protein [Zoogloeaceae bacterium]|nr:ATP-binding protein [Zoogloeaceae bacterium]